jgi:hypothetical protein
VNPNNPKQRNKRSEGDFLLSNEHSDLITLCIPQNRDSPTFCLSDSEEQADEDADFSGSLNKFVDQFVEPEAIKRSKMRSAIISEDSGEFEKEEGLISDIEVRILPDSLPLVAGDDFKLVESQENHQLSGEDEFVNSEKQH